jgi:outer membrane receptor protein involved in Fe transport
MQDNSTFNFYSRPVIKINDTSLANLLAGGIISQTQYFYLDGNSERGFRETDQGYFVQDNWQATHRLMVSAGLRYEIFPAYSEVQNRIVNAFVVDGNGIPQACKALPYGADMANVAVVNGASYGITA